MHDDSRLRDIWEVLKHFKNYFSGNLAAKALGLVSIPIMTRLLSTQDYGSYQVFSSYVGIMTVLLTLNFHGSVARYYWDEPADFDAFVGTSLWGSLFLLGISSSILLFAPAQVAQLLGMPEGLLFYLLPLVILSVVYAVYNQICIATKQSARATQFSLFKTYIGFGVGVLLVYIIPSSTYLGIIWGQLGAGIFFFLYAMFWLHSQIRWAPKLSHLRFLAAYSIPLVPYTLSNIILGQFDRIMINNTVGASEAGVYSLAYNIGLIMSIITSSFQAAVAPDWFRLMKEEAYLRVDALVSRIFKFTLAAALGLILFSQELLVVLADIRFHAALPIIPVVVIGYVFDAMFKFYGRNISYTNKMIYMTLIGVLASSVNVGLNMLFIARYGYIAAAYTTVIAFALMFVLAWWVAKYHLRQRVTPLSVLWRPLVPFIVSTVLYYVIVASDISGIWGLALKSIILVGFSLQVLVRPMLTTPTPRT